MAGDYIRQLEGSAPTKHQALAALQYFFDAMLTRHVVLLNCFGSVRGVKLSVTEDKTAEISIERAHKLFRSSRRQRWVTRHIVERISILRWNFGHVQSH